MLLEKSAQIRESDLLSLRLHERSLNGHSCKPIALLKAVFPVFWCFLFSILSQKWRCTLFCDENKWSKVKTLQDTPRSRWPGFFNKLCEKCYRKSCKYMHNNSTRLQGKFRAQRYGDMWPTKVGKPWKEKKVVHTSCRHGIMTYKDPAPKTLD